MLNQLLCSLFGGSNWQINLKYISKVWNNNLLQSFQIIGSTIRWLFQLSIEFLNCWISVVVFLMWRQYMHHFFSIICVCVCVCGMVDRTANLDTSFSFNPLILRWCFVIVRNAFFVRPFRQLTGTRLSFQTSDDNAFTLCIHTHTQTLKTSLFTMVTEWDLFRN